MNEQTREKQDQAPAGVAIPRRISKSVRVRLLVAVPAVIVLLLSLLAWILFWVTDAYMTTATVVYQGSQRDFARDWLKVLWLFVVGGAMIGYVLAWSLTRPVRDMIRLAERVASGDLTSKADENRNDEMGELSSSFNYMLESLNHFIETRNRFILESFTGGLVITDINGTITAVNSSAEKLLQLRNHEVSGKSIREVFARDEFAELLRLHERVIWKQESIKDQRLDLLIDNKVLPVMVGFTPMRDSSNNIFGVIINVRDRAEMEKFYQHLKNADRLATMGTFATGLAHEIRNPLGAIKATAQLLQEDLGPNSSSAEYLHIITKEVNRLDTLVQEVQAYSQPAFDKVPMDFSRLMEEITQLVSSDERFKSRNIRLEKDIKQMPRMLASKNQLRQALLNMLINAVDASPEGGTIRVNVDLASMPGRLARVVIENEGDPIPPHIQERIFEPFFTTKGTGTGLGLPIAAQVIANHGGRLTVECSDGWIRFIMLIATETTPLGSVILDGSNPASAPAS